REILYVYAIVTWATAIIAVVVFVLLAWVLVRYRDRPGAAPAAQTRGHSLLEIGWTIAPALILLIIAIPTIQVIFRTQGRAAPGELGRGREAQKAPRGEWAGDAAEGQAIYARLACVGCHTIPGVSGGVIGPALTHVGSRRTIAAGLLPNTPENLAAWLRAPER